MNDDDLHPLIDILSRKGSDPTAIASELETLAGFVLEKSLKLPGVIVPPELISLLQVAAAYRALAVRQNNNDDLSNIRTALEIIARRVGKEPLR
jgi:hypothetical protein